MKNAAENFSLLGKNEQREKKSDVELGDLPKSRNDGGDVLVEAGEVLIGASRAKFTKECKLTKVTPDGS